MRRKRFVIADGHYNSALRSWANRQKETDVLKIWGLYGWLVKFEMLQSSPKSDLFRSKTPSIGDGLGCHPRWILFLKVLEEPNYYTAPLRALQCGKGTKTSVAVRFPGTFSGYSGNPEDCCAGSWSSLVLFNISFVNLEDAMIRPKTYSKRTRWKSHGKISMAGMVIITKLSVTLLSKCYFLLLACPLSSQHHVFLILLAGCPSVFCATS